MPIPRRFDRRPPERDQTRINERIRVPEVRLIGDDGQQVGVVKTDQALRYAQERDLDLVEVAPEARPPVVRVLDYSKYKYEQEQKAKAARRHQKQITIREIKLRPKIANNDYETKKGHVRRFLGSQDKVKITIMFRGRETTHPERGEQLLMRLAEDVADLGAIEQRPNLDGRNMTMVLGPVKAKEGGEGHPQDKHDDSPTGKDSRRNRAAAEAAATDEAPPAAAEESVPAPAEESAPAPVDDSAPAPADDSVPAPADEEPAAEEEIRRSA
ncbi:MAG TPA: translation initiation factor IF-3 [Thermoleophilaceae bacterium]